MRKEPDEDLFKDSTMTFGEHLEELRTCLWRAIFGLVIGFLIGLFFSDRVVQFIQVPLTSALEDFYQAQSAELAEAKLAELKVQGKPLPSDRELLKRRIQEGMMPIGYYLDPKAIIEQYRESHQEEGKEAKPPSDAAEKPSDKKAGSAAPSGQKPREPVSTVATAESGADAPDDLMLIFLWQPKADDARLRPETLNAQEAFGIYVKGAILVGVIFACPWVFYQIWTFVAAGLYPHEKYYVHVFLPISIGLFLAGALLAFFFVFQPVLYFLFQFNSWMHLDPRPRISEWLSFVLLLPVGFGISFQLPLVMLFLERIGIFSVESYLSKWRVSVLVIFVLSAILTPADPYSLLLMAVPLTGLYFGGVAFCKFMPRRKSPYDDLED